jgi:hypothetical protein
MIALPVSFRDVRVEVTPFIEIDLLASERRWVIPLWSWPYRVGFAVNMDGLAVICGEATGLTEGLEVLFCECGRVDTVTRSPVGIGGTSSRRRTNPTETTRENDQHEDGEYATHVYQLAWNRSGILSEELVS